MVCCLTKPSHYLNQCFPNDWHDRHCNLTEYASDIYAKNHLKLIFKQFKHMFGTKQWVEMQQNVDKRLISQIPECICAISHYALFYNRNAHISATKCCIVGYGTDAFWDFWDGLLLFFFSDDISYVDSDTQTVWVDPTLAEPRYCRPDVGPTLRQGE